MKQSTLVRSLVPGEGVVASGIFQATGSMTARFSGFGEWSVRRREREEREASGLAFKRYMLVVVTDAKVHLFDARSGLTGWRAARELAAWDRAAVQASAKPNVVTVRLTLSVPAENRRLELEAPKRRARTTQVVQELTGSTVVQHVAREQGITSGSDDDLNPSLAEAHRTAGLLALTGGVARMVAYALPWATVTGTQTGRSVDVSGYRLLGQPFISVGYSLVIVVASLFYLAGRREAGRRLLLSLGVGSVIVFGLQYPFALHNIAELRSLAASRHLPITVSSSAGMWIELLGMLAVLAGGVLAYRAWKRTNVSPRRPYVGPPPDLTFAAGSR